MVNLSLSLNDYKLMKKKSMKRLALVKENKSIPSVTLNLIPNSVCQEDTASSLLYLQMVNPFTQ